VSSPAERPIDIIKVKDLQAGDKIAYGSLLGFVTAADDLTVKSVEEAAKGHYAVTLYRVGTMFLIGEATVELVAED
jgi:hypothetical protein